MSINNEIRRRIDYTNLNVSATTKDIDILCKRAINYKTATVCVAPCWVEYISHRYPVNVATVIGFPNGYTTTAVKVAESIDAIRNGASEIDMVINQGWIKEGEIKKVVAEIVAVKKAIQGHILKVIFEECNLDSETIAKLAIECNNLIVNNQKGVEYIKTSTGFGKSGASEETVKIMLECAPNCKIKASGGIRSKSDAKKYVYNYQCSRIGASAYNVIKSEVGERIHLTQRFGLPCDIIGVVESNDNNIITIRNEFDQIYIINDVDDVFEIIESEE